MLRRRSLKSTSDLNRRKSTSSTHGVHLEHIDAAQAQRDAQIAASQAFARAQIRSKSDMSLFPPTPGSSPRRQHLTQSTPGRESKSTPTHNRHAKGDVRHQQSVRFVGPCPALDKANNGTGIDCEDNPGHISSEPPDRQDDLDANGSQSYTLGNDSYMSAPPPRHPRRAPPPIPLTGVATGYLESLAAADEYYTPEDNVASLPSSYRRLRRSRSMFSSEAQDSGTGREAPPPPPPPTGTHTRKLFYSEPRKMEREPTLPQLRAPKSMSFLKNRHLLRSGSNTDAENHPHAPPENPCYVTDQFDPKSNTETLAHFGARSQGGGAESRMRKSLRSSNSSGEGPDVSAFGGALPVNKQDGLKLKARKVSRSLRTRLKSFFTISKSEDTPPTIPFQHIEARKTHVTDGFGTLDCSDAELEAQSDDGWEPIQHTVQAKVPSLQLGPSNILRSNKGSVESLRSERERDRQVSDDRSLTTWAHSGPSTLTSQQQQQWREWERQRLSIIKENGAHAPSSSARRKVLGANLFQCPDNDEIRGAVPPMPSVDSQRVYSALMRRMEILNTYAEATTEHAPLCQSDDSEVPPTVVAKKPSARMLEATTPSRMGRMEFLAKGADQTPTRASRGSRQTDEQNAIDAPTPNLRQGCLEKARKEAKELCAAFRGGRSRSGSTGTVGSVHDIPEPSGRDGLPLFAPSISGSRAAERTVSDRNGAFFGSPASHLFRTESPYRRALRRSIQEQQNVWSQQPLPSGHDIGSDQLKSSHADGGAGSTEESETSDSRRDLGYSESIYSTDEVVVQEQGNHVARRMQEDRKQEAQKNKDQVPMAAYQPAGFREPSSASSVDWKTWLSANVAKLDSSPTRLMPAEVEFALPTMPKCFTPSGHVREAAQICGEEDMGDYGGGGGGGGDYFEIFPLQARQPTLPTTPLSPVEPNVVKLSTLQRCLKRNTPPSTGTARATLLENDSPKCSSGGELETLPAPPPIPLKSALRPSPLKISKSSMNNPGGGGVARSITSPSVTSSPGLTAAVQRQFGPVGDGRRHHRMSGSGGRDERYRMAEKFLKDRGGENRCGGDTGDDGVAFI
ncbi:hypothetical protein QBC42DRAFT_237800 [Cladorrhinum samala]|uniref:Uncharacterized protein n=1 Tax=Cladorrhinum samala TaxID=585594 RepID=A0AAV9HA48_9PEZI|nr:hypothetical protein QBC42DRAFT_237800 [Cladorrhinum samala]